MNQIVLVLVLVLGNQEDESDEVENDEDDEGAVHGKPPFVFPHALGPRTQSFSSSSSSSSSKPSWPVEDEFENEDEDEGTVHGKPHGFPTAHRSHEHPPHPPFGHPLPLRGGEGWGEGAVHGEPRPRPRILVCVDREKALRPCANP